MKSAVSEGIDPLNVLTLKSMNCRLVSPLSEGIDPLNVLKLRLSICKSIKLPSKGIEPLKLLKFRLILITCPPEQRTPCQLHGALVTFQPLVWVQPEPLVLAKSKTSTSHSLDGISVTAEQFVPALPNRGTSIGRVITVVPAVATLFGVVLAARTFEVE